MQLFESKSVEERVILVGIQDSREDEVKSLRELEELVDTAGAVTVGKVIQKRESIHPASYVGPGKLEELRELLYTLDATGIVCDDELSPAQYAVLEEELECKVMDRTLVILDIFAGRAATKEGKLQVELAQLKYRAARLVGLRRSLSRLGGGIGTRGPGEKKLEVDRRVIHGRISQLKRELEEVHRHQELLRGRRIKGNQKVAAIVGYTNAGKSTLLNALTGSQVMEEDKLFATLDPTTRMLELPGGQQMLLTDTVGFIRKLPHHLVEAFKSTLEEAKYCDIILHVVDSSNPQMDVQMYVVYDTLKQLAKKWPLVAITNGNAQPELFGLGDYFEFVLRAGPHGRSKPFSDMYFLAAEKLNVPIGEILHVGDDLTTDVGGAIRSGMQACWIRPENGDLMQTWDSRLLPHLEISRLASLTSLI